MVLDGNLLEQPQGWATSSGSWSDSAPAVLGSDPLSLNTQGSHQVMGRRCGSLSVGDPPRSQGSSMLQGDGHLDV